MPRKSYSLNYYRFFTVVLEDTWTVLCKIELKIGRMIRVEATVFLRVRIFVVGFLHNHVLIWEGRQDFFG